MATTKKKSTPVKGPANKLTVAQYIEHQIEISDLSQAEIARACGFEQPNMISMLKVGKTKLAMARVPALAKVLGVDARHLFMLCISEYLPDAYEAFEGMMKQPVVTANEEEILNIIRSANPNDPRIRTAEEEAGLRNYITDLASSKESFAAKVKAEGREAERAAKRERKQAAEATDE